MIYNPTGWIWWRYVVRVIRCSFEAASVNVVLVELWSAVQLPVQGGCVWEVEWSTFPGEDCVRFLLWRCCGPARLKIAGRSSSVTFDDGCSTNPQSQMVPPHTHLIPLLPGDSQELGHVCLIILWYSISQHLFKTSHQMCGIILSRRVPLYY